MAKRLNLTVGDVEEDAILSSDEDKERRKLALALQEQIGKINGKNISAAEKLSQIQLAIEKATPFFIQELISPTSEMVDRSLVVNKLISSLTSVASLEKSKVDMQLNEDLDVRSPKFGAVFAWFIELIQAVAQEVLTPDMLTMFMRQLVVRLDGWESRVEYSLKGLSAKKLESVMNPLLSSDMERNLSQWTKDAEAKEAERQRQFENMIRKDDDTLQ